MRTAAVVVIVLLIGLIIGVRELIEKYQREKVVESAENIKVTPLVQPPLVGDAGKAAIGTPSPMALGNQPVPTTDGKPDAKAENKAEATPGVSAAPPSAATATATAPVAVPKPAVTPPPPTTAAVPPPTAKIPENKAPVVKPPEAKPPAPAAPVAQAKPETKPPPPPPVATATTAPTAKEASDTAKAAEAGKSGLKGVKNEIILEALDKVDVKFQVKGETKRVSLAPTQVHTIHSDQPVVLDLSDGGAVNIILNGHDQGPPGALGQPKQIKIP